MERHSSGVTFRLDFESHFIAGNPLFQPDTLVAYDECPFYEKPRKRSLIFPE